MNCKDCIHKEFQKGNGSPSRYYCIHPEAIKGVGSRMICRTERGATELTVKTAPKWCPYRKK